MKNFLLALLLSLFCTTSFAQTQQGIVKTRGRMINGQLVAGQRLSGATITLNFGNALVSGNQGGFSFAVPINKKFSLLKAQKQGYTLSDPEYTRRSFKYSASNPFYVVLEDENQRQADINAATEKLRKTLTFQLKKREEEIENLKSQNIITKEEYEKRYHRLYDDMTKTELMIQEIANQYALLDYDEIEDFWRENKQLIIEGDLVAAKNKLDSRGQYEQLKDDLENTQKQKEHFIKLESQKLEEFGKIMYANFQLYMLSHKTDSAAFYIEMRANQDTTNVEWQIEAGHYFCEYMAQYDKALFFYNRALSQALLNNDNNVSIANCYVKMGELHRLAADFNESLNCYKKAEKVLPENDPFIAICYIRQGEIYSEEDNMVKAIELYNNAINIFEKDTCNLEMAKTYNEMGNICRRMDELDKALENYNKAKKLQESIFGAEHPEIAKTLNLIGCIYRMRNQFDDAIKYHTSALSIFRKYYTKDHPSIAYTLYELGGDYNNMNNGNEAYKYFLKSKEIYTTVFGSSNHPDIANVLLQIGGVYRRRGDYTCAYQNESEAIEILIKCYGKEHSKVANGYNMLGNILKNSGNYDEALKYYEKSLSIRQKLYGEKNTKVAESYNNIALIYMKSNKPDYKKALDFLQKSLNIRIDVSGVNNQEVASCYNNLGNLYYNLGILNNKKEDYIQSLDYHQKALDIKNKIFNEDNESKAMSYSNIGVVYESMGDYAKAKEYYSKSLNIYSSLYKDNHPKVIKVKSNLEDVIRKIQN